MKEINQTCGDCVFFRRDPTAKIDRNSPMFAIRKAVLGEGAIKAEDGGSAEPPVYGKCKAEYDSGHYDFGTTSDMPVCRATDELGGPLFKRK